ncbi:TIGR03943 family protein [Nocardiopsis sp. EMB25]|uniref:TIGR03943 family putative permease subunit n=1 Tax=Nocardiopsis sp. EMB25 TaxID=2835867 RepID=UPI002284F31C|nr:TIGR03943 family protein [Nocardiopsis sp. EMB25]MCY9784422.1 TIGR03943 family protein [Nocardiopsis sp. EMB25]
MNRIAQGLTLVLLGAAALTSTVPTNMYLNWVKPGFGPFLIAAGVVTVALGVAVVAAEIRGGSRAEDDGADHSACAVAAAEGSADGGGRAGHDHARAPRVAWLLLVPVLAVFVVAPPALGSYTVERSEPASAPQEGPPSGRFDDGLDEAAPGEVVRMDIRQFVMRAWVDEERALAGREVELTGFAVPNDEGEGWYLARLQMACCAADAIVNRVLVTGGPEPEADTWWTVRGTWVEPEGELVDVSEHRFDALEWETVDNPPDPYEA